MASQYPPKKNTAFTLFFSLFKTDGTLIANPGTITKKVSIDGGAVADIAASVTEEDTTYGQLSVVLAAGEMNGDAIWVYIVDDTAGCIPFICTIYTAAQTLDEVYARLGAPVGASMSADIAAIEAQTDDIGAAGAGLTAITGVTLAADQAVNVTKISGDSAAADTLELFAEALDQATGQLDSGSFATGTLAVEADIAAAVRDVDNTTPAVGSLGAMLNTIEGQTDDIGTAGAGLTAILNRLIALALTTGVVVADAGNTASSFRTNLPGGDDFWKDAVVLITSGALAGQQKKIGGFADTNGVITLVATETFTDVPAGDVTIAILNR